VNSHIKAKTTGLPIAAFLVFSVFLGLPVSASGLTSQFCSTDADALQVMSGAPYNNSSIAGVERAEMGNGDIVKLNMSDNGREVIIQSEKILEVELSDASASTGYEWSVANLDKECLELLKEEKVITPPEGGKTGQPVIKRWYLRALKVGSTELVFSLNRPWESHIRSGKLYRIKLHIYK
jgi:predicted secreted protein